MSTLLRAIHAEGRKRGLDHAALHDLAAERFGVGSMRELTADQLQEWYEGWTGRRFRAKRRLSRERAQAAGTAGRKGRGTREKGQVIQLVSGEDWAMLDRCAAKLGWDQKTLRSFIRRQIRGKIRTLDDFNKVLWGMKGILRRRNRAVS